MPMSDLTGVLFDGGPSMFDGERDIPQRTRP